MDIQMLINNGNIYKHITDELKKIATSYTYKLSIFMDEWLLPSGAYGENCGAV